ncbi:nuclear localization protein [Histoplasma capsulatum G186AR]|uniref:Nuclear localization protein n=2 Tax=Ajellomyces capsulatus TaxID=5037 RepID=C0NV50_AJECG|nr:nuclear localization protein [Histoplasma capsulatum G186AR]EEH04863.1 nuclear localization protein [Histoplasma capsulatum G186AR]KAG5287521.1 nuclear localization protein [Histoplasma capsulatum]QSS70665.1 nuclear localization protein [Histoplasma capsulatum G186AR]
MARKQRAAAQAAAQSLRAAPQQVDEEMPDAAPSNSPTPRDADDDTPKEKDETPVTEEQEAESQSERQAEESDGPSPATPNTPMRTGRVSAIPRKRGGRVGRPPKIRAPVVDDGAGEARSEVSTPVRRRGRGRPSAGGRWGRAKGGPSHVTQVPIDKEGNMMDVINDEVDLPEDPEGETKVDKLGNLLGGREYRVRTFTILNKGERLYMLSTEPARCIGFRDSYLFFQKHRLLFKIIIDDDAKRDLIERDLIPHSYKGRAIGVVTARSVFREFGAKIIIGGRKVIDDYSAQAARERGDVEGELAVPEDKLPGPGETYDKNRYVAWHGASSVYHSGAPSVPMPMGKTVDPKKRKVIVTGDNWMIEHAREASRFNSTLLAARRENLDGHYDIHTNIMQYPRIMQSTHVRWEIIPPPESTRADRSQLISSASTAALGVTDGTPASSVDDVKERTSNDLPSQVETDKSTKTSSTIFPSVPAIFSRNFEIQDIYYETPPESSLGLPGPDGDVRDIGSNGLISISLGRNTPLFHTSPEVLAELPRECQIAYREAAVREWEWKSRWRSEREDGLRAPLKLNYSWNP